MTSKEMQPLLTKVASYMRIYAYTHCILANMPLMNAFTVMALSYVYVSIITKV